MESTTITADTILSLLATRHSSDVFVPECKNGPTHTAGENGMVRMDAWVMPRSWTKASVHAYEIKVSRQDFLRDQKWRRYLPYCNQFWFAVAQGVCDPAEIPEGCGLVVASKNGGKLYTKIKAPYRDIKINEDVFRYVLMCRSQVTREHSHGEDNAAYWRNWLATKEENREIGHRVSAALSKRYREDVWKIESDNKWLKAENEKFADFKEMCERIGVSPSRFLNDEALKTAVYEHQQPINQRALKQYISKLEFDVKGLASLVQK